MYLGERINNYLSELKTSNSKPFFINNEKGYKNMLCRLFIEFRDMVNTKTNINEDQFQAIKKLMVLEVQRMLLDRSETSRNELLADDDWRIHFPNSFLTSLATYANSCS